MLCVRRRRRGRAAAPVEVRPEPEGVTLDDPAFEPLPGRARRLRAPRRQRLPDRDAGPLERPARAVHARVRGARPDRGRHRARHPPVPDRPGLRLGRLELQQHVADPRAARPTRPPRSGTSSRAGTGGRRRTYVTGLSMGGMATHIAAERYGNRFDGALALCGAAGQTPAAADRRRLLRRRRVRRGRDPEGVRPRAGRRRADPRPDPPRAATAARCTGASRTSWSRSPAGRGRSTARASASRRRRTGGGPSCWWPPGSRANRAHRVPPRAAQPRVEPGVQPRGHPLPHQPCACCARSWPATRPPGGWRCRC